jgi:dipeptidyl aminopeptidase/acylaminoacyl peptidase
MARTAPFGTWTSPITLDRLVERVVGLTFPAAVDGAVYWSESRPAEGGRSVLVRRRAGAADPEDVFGPGLNARTLVHEYGGLCYAVAGDVVYLSNYADQRLYRVTPGEAPAPITPEPPSPRAVRYAAPVLTPDARHLVVVRERHGDPDLPSTVVNDLVAVPVGGGPPLVLAEGHDFFSSPVVSPDGRRLAWISWDHPNMPWDGTELWEAELDHPFSVVSPRKVAGGPGESVLQPKYGPGGELLFVSDRTGWWNLYAASQGGERPLAPMAAEIGAPDWVFGTSSYAVLGDGSILAAWSEAGLGRLGVLPPGAAAFAVVRTPWTTFAYLRAADDGRSVVCVAGSAAEPSSVVRLTPREDGAHGIEVLRRSREETVAPRYLSVPEPIVFPTAHGRSAHALFYAPRNGDFDGPPEERPPLVVRIHGGPTSAATSALDYGIQFWTSRGFALVDVNYGGSTGYGRPYRERLRGNWGVVDLEDAVHAARHLVASGRADGGRLVIHGGSAGGYTTLCAVTFTDAFAAGASYFGIADTIVFAKETHKFESHYTDALFGPWPEAEDVYRERSPALHTEQLRTPLIVFQGLEDRIVPPDQAEIMVAALAERGVPHAYVAYEGEQHGFRRAENVRRTAEAELYFFGRVLGFTPADDLRPVEIVHEGRLRR